MERSVRFQCGNDGCREAGYYSYRNKEEYKRLYEKYGNGKYKCLRHSNPDRVLSIENKKITNIFTSNKSEKYPQLEELFWDGGRGLITGTGYLAYADDFPKGTKLILTAEIILPDDK